MSRNRCMQVVFVLTALAVATVGVGCGEKEEAVTIPRTQAADVQPEVKMVPKPTPEMDKAFEAFKKAQSVPAARVPMVAKAPEIDGVMDDIYKAATPLKFKFLVGGDDEPTAPTTVYVVSTDKELFIFYNCESPDMDMVTENVTEHDGAVWGDDSIEIFIDPDNKRDVSGYMHIGINILGTTYEAKGPKGDADATWDPKLRVKTKKGPKAWTMEVAIPFAELVKDPAQMNRIWAVNFNRMAYLVADTEDTAWSQTGTTDSHVPSQFGCLWLDAGKVDNTK